MWQPFLGSNQSQTGLFLCLQFWFDGIFDGREIFGRLRLRALVKLIEHRKGSPVYTDFTDEMGEESEISLPGFTSAISFERFKEKARAFLREHLDNEAIQKLRMNEPLTPEDLSALHEILLSSGVGDAGSLQKAAEFGLGVFVKSLVGLDREAAKAALGKRVASDSLNGTQIEFLNMIVEYLTDHGIMEPRALYESPFTDLSPLGPDQIFSNEVVDGIVELLREIRLVAVP